MYRASAPTLSRRDQPLLSLTTAFFCRRAIVLALGLGAGWWPTAAQAGNSLRAGNMSSTSGSNSASPTSQTATAATDANAEAVQTGVIAQHAQVSMMRSLQALQAIQASQAATHLVAGSGANNLGLDPNHPGQMLPNVPDGLTAGGLMPTAGLNPVSTSATATAYQVPAGWTGVSNLAQSTAAGQVADTITQSQQQALLTWQSFNIGKNTTLNFDQSAGGANVSQWVAINQIQDPSLRPSQILGAINAPGQVYVINQNGIIFGGSSQVNVGALTASSLALNPAYLNNGLLNNSGNNYQFQFSSLEITTKATTGGHGHQVTTTTVAPLWTVPPTVTGTATTQTVSSVPTGDITVQAGAQLTSPTNSQNQGGRIALIAPNVTNDGTISTPDGQTILAAGLQVGFAAHDANDASLRGLDVYIGQVSGVASSIPTGTFTFQGLPGNGQLTFAGSGQVGSYMLSGTVTPILGGVPVTIPAGSTVDISSGSPSFAAVQAGVATNAANTLDGSGNIIVPGGDIEAARGDVTMAGANVNQLGVINVSTSVTLNGRIDLLADFDSAAGTVGGTSSFYPFSTGTVTFGNQSVTQILPETSSSATTIGLQLALSSLVDVQAQDIEMESDSLLYAPGANIPSASSNNALDLAGEKLTAGVTFNAGTWAVTEGTSLGSEKTAFSNSLGTINLASGSIIDVSGSENVTASVSENIVSVQLRGPQLADSPVQRTGQLRGTSVNIDIRQVGVYDGQTWIGTPLGDLSGYANDVDRTVGELTIAGGTVDLNSGGSVTTDAGSSINVSGGWINYSGATVQTTRVLYDGQIVDISQAMPSGEYGGIYTGFSSTSQRWGVTQNFINPLFAGSHYEPGYIQGGNGGAISITAPAMNLGGTVYGNTVTGPYQQTQQSALATTFATASFLPTTLSISGVPLSGQLDLSFLQAQVGADTNVYPSTSPSVWFETDSSISQNAPAANQILLSQDIINSDGFGIVSIDTSAGGNIVVPAGVELTAPAGGLLTFDAANIDIEGSIAVPGGGTSGGMNFTVSDYSPDNEPVNSTPSTSDPTRGVFILGANASLSSSGLLVNQVGGGTVADSTPLLITGGNISIEALDAELMPGSRIDVSGGLAVNSTGKATFGSAGSISILGGIDFAVAGGQKPSPTSVTAGGRLILGSTLTGYSGAVGGGGTLTIQAPLVQLGGVSLLNGDSSGQSFTNGEAGVTSDGTTLALDSSFGPAGDFFSQGGFGTFNIEGLGRIETDSNGDALFNSSGDPIISPAVLITSDVNLHPLVQGAAATYDNGNLGLMPLTPAQVLSELPSQRSVVNLTFNAEGVTSTLPSDGPPTAGGAPYSNGTGAGGLLIRGDLVLQAGAQIQTDPQTNSSHGVSLQAAQGTVAILGRVIAPGGTISVKGGSTSGLSSNELLFYENTAEQPFATVDLGPGSLLSTAGGFEQTANSLGYTTGSVLPGGNITISGNIVAQQGAVLDVSGAKAVVDESATALGERAGSIAALNPIATTVAGDAGTITFKAMQLLYSDATLLGSAGGPSAQGGTLAVSAGYATTSGPNVTPPLPVDVSLIVSQTGLNGGFSLPSDLGTGTAVLGQIVPGSTTAVGATVNSAIMGEAVDSYFAAYSNLFSSTVVDSSTANNGGRAGGFVSLNLGGTVDFVGPVTISAARSLSVALATTSAAGDSGGVIYADSPVILSAPYVALNLDETSAAPDPIPSAAYPAATGGSGSLTIDASTLADVGNVSLQGINALAFNTSGTAGDIRGEGTLQVAGSIALNAAQIYPPTEQTFTIEANDVSISAPAGQPPPLPLSAGGTLNVFANTIEQDGVLRAPFGVINLGTGSTTSVTLGAGSITSVSGVDPVTHQGITVPYGIINDSGIWYDPQGNDINPSLNVDQAELPAKSIKINGQNVDIAGGSTIDISGGGDLLAYSFTAGTGGNQDILASSTSFAIIPGYSAAYAAVGTYANNSSSLTTNGVADQGYFNSTLAVGEQIYLNAGSGVPAGTYTLLPARYALLPGAFLVTSAGSAAPGATIQQADGSSLVSGYVTSGLNPKASPTFSAFSVASQAVVLNRAPYTIDLATDYFPTQAASSGISAPRLPIDAGQLVLNAGNTMEIEGSLLSQAAPGGLGGEVDIASTENIYIVGSAEESAVPVGALDLDSSQLTQFGAASLLIGGYRTTTEQGTLVTVTTGTLVVDNNGAAASVNGNTVDGLAAPDLILVSNADLQVDDFSSIQSLGSTSQAPLLTLQGDGSLLRLSNDPTAQILRQNVVPGDTTSNLSIGQGVRIFGAGDGPAGSLTLDSTAAFEISHPTGLMPTILLPVLLAQNLKLDASQINLELSTPTTEPTSGLIITPDQLNSFLSTTQSLSLFSYSSIGLYGSGSIGTRTPGVNGTYSYQESNLALHADDIYYADTQNSAGITINAQTVSLDNLAAGTILPTLTGLGSSPLTIDAQTITLGSGAMQMDQFTDVALNADSALLLQGLGQTGSDPDAPATAAALQVNQTGILTLTAPLMTSAKSADQSATSSTTSGIDEAIRSTGAVVIQASGGTANASPGALDASFSITGNSVTQESGVISLPSGNISLQANGPSNSYADLVVDGTLDAGGVSSSFFGLNKYTNGGSVTLGSVSGNVMIGSTGFVNVAAVSGEGTVDSGAGSGGVVTITAARDFVPGSVNGAGSTITQAGSGAVIARGANGTFNLDAGTLDGVAPGTVSLSNIEAGLGGFSTQSIRDRLDTTVIVNGGITAGSFNLSADAGSILVTGTVNAANVAGTDPAGNLIEVGGDIGLAAEGSVITQAGSLLTVAGSQFNNAGEGGAVTIEAGAYEGNSTLDSSAHINLGGNIDLSVAGGTGGTLLLRAPQVSGGQYGIDATTPVAVNASGGGSPTDVAIAPVTGVILNSSSIIVEGAYVQDAAQTGTAAIDGFEANAVGTTGTNGNAFAFMANSSTIQNRIFGASSAPIHIQPGEEIDNSLGSLELQSTWDLSSLRYGAGLTDGQGNPILNAAGNPVLSEPGVLTIRAAGNLNFDFGASLTDGFDTSALGFSYLDPLLPAGSRSWAYNLTAGSGFGANSADLSSLATLNSAAYGATSTVLGGSLQIGYQNSSAPSLVSTTTSDSQSAFFQTIRTGSGDININAGGSVLLLNNLATIYTAGTQVDGTDGGAFSPPSGSTSTDNPLPATYSSAGGNVAITAQGSIAHLAYNPGGTTLQLQADSSAEMPTNWLDREGSVSNGQIVLPTTWWVDFTNFFEGVGALGGGNVTLDAGGSVVNVDALVPTNAREINGSLVELGGGDLTVHAGDNIDAGVYYVERGNGSLSAGGDILTNSTRAAVTLSASPSTLDYLPTTLFVGEGNFSLNAGGNLLLGPVANPFLLPQSYNNIASTNTPALEISYFSTYASTDQVNASALTGSVTLQDHADVGGQGSLAAWYDNVLDASATSPTTGTPSSEISDAEPWLTLAEGITPARVKSDLSMPSNPNPGSPGNAYGGVAAIMPSTLRVTSYSGDIDVVGDLTLSPSALGTVDLLAAGSVNAFTLNQITIASSSISEGYGSGLINLSDANPDAIPSATSPFSSGTLLGNLAAIFDPTGATEGLTVQVKEDLHADINGAPLHVSDPNPAYIVAEGGDISGLTLFSPKQTDVVASQDITDIGLYLQNDNSSDISVVSAGRDILAYDATSPLRQAAGTNLIQYDPNSAPLGDGAGAPNTGDIQIAGPGTLEVLTGRNFTLGNDDGLNPNNTTVGDGLFAGLTSVGDQENLALPFTGADLVAAAGLGGASPAAGLSKSGGSLDFSDFINQFLDPNSSLGPTYLADIAPKLGLGGAATQEIWNAFSSLPDSQEDALALDAFYLVLRDAGRDHNDSTSPGFGVYTIGYNAIQALLPAGQSYLGDIDITSREIKTSNGGDIDLLVPGGQVTVGVNDQGGSSSSQNDKAADQGIVTVSGGNISIFAHGDVNVGTSRIFTLDGGNEIIWSTTGNIDAGASSKTVVSAPPTRVLVDPTSGSVETDLAGLSTGGGIGVLASVIGAAVSDVDLIAPQGTIDAGDAGIRATGNLNVSALKVLNADNISVGGKSTGTPATASVNVGAVTAASSAAGSSVAAASNAGPASHPNNGAGTQDVPSIITVEVVGYGGGAQD